MRPRDSGNPDKVRSKVSDSIADDMERVSAVNVVEIQNLDDMAAFVEGRAEVCESQIVPSLCRLGVDQQDSHSRSLLGGRIHPSQDADSGGEIEHRAENLRMREV